MSSTRLRSLGSRRCAWTRSPYRTGSFGAADARAQGARARDLPAATWPPPGPAQARRLSRADGPGARDGRRRVQGSRELASALDALALEPPLFPVDEDERRAVEEAERWGEEELQEVARRIFRWAAAREGSVRRWLAEIAGLPAPGVAGALNVPVAREFVRRSGATDARVGTDIEAAARDPGPRRRPWYRAGSWRRGPECRRLLDRALGSPAHGL